MTITSSVRTHNGFGKAYMWPVAPAHKVIVNLTLAQLRRTVAQAKITAREISPPDS
ncbi:DUF2867 domain-containing protein [Aliiroseovarius lamellibrachiae]|uniref:DUF2867 domain-containing protein n=1 Tax=Aliiroseovarius lamellibrachiae TaxID=1924933 RepID=UPI0031B84A74